MEDPEDHYDKPVYMVYQHRIGYFIRLKTGSSDYYAPKAALALGFNVCSVLAPYGLSSVDKTMGPCFQSLLYYKSINPSEPT